MGRIGNLRSVYHRYLNQYKVFLNSNLKTYQTEGKSRGRALVSYLGEYPKYRDDHPFFMGHPNKWENKEICTIFQKLGFTTDAVPYYNARFKPSDKYDVVFDIFSNTHRWINYIEGSRKVIHFTGSYSRFQNASELKRIEDFHARTGKYCSPKRLVGSVEFGDLSLRYANNCSLIGNEFTLNTFPSEFRNKITLIRPTTNPCYEKQKGSFIPQKKEFIWFNGYGAILKGLDLTIEAFEKNPHLTLNIVGNVESEDDFMRVYKNRMKGNIRYHGFIKCNEPRFKEVVNRCFCFVSPSASEGVSTASATMLKVGLYPLISRENGITLPRAGKYLEECSVDEISASINDIQDRSERDISEEISICQDYARNNYCRKVFSSDMTNFLTTIT